MSTYFSLGFYSQDEHFQVLSPVEYLLGINYNFKNEIWEFSEEYKIRPWFQSYLYFFIIKFIKIIGFENPFIWVFILKLISSLLGFLALLWFYLNFRNIFFKDNTFNRLFIFLFFFYPYFHARTSSENIGTSFFVLGFIIFYNIIIYNNKRNYVLNTLACGILFGLAIISRYQILIFILPLYFWAIIFHISYDNLKKLFIIGCSIILVLIFGLYLDSHGYESFNLTYYKYFYANFIGGMLDFFGSDPWWYYLNSIVINFAPPIGLLFLVSLLVLFFKSIKNSIVFISIFYLIIFSIISHKELRFLFPLFFFTPFIICMFLDKLNNLKLYSIFKYIIIIPNFLFLTFLSFIPATEQVSVYKFIYDNKIKQNLYYIEDNPYVIAGLEPKLYTSFLPKIKKFQDNLKTKSNYHLILREFNIYENLILSGKCRKDFSVYPDFINQNPNWRKHKINWFILNCNS